MTLPNIRADPVAITPDDVNNIEFIIDTSLTKNVAYINVIDPAMHNKDPMVFPADILPLLELLSMLDIENLSIIFIHN